MYKLTRKEAANILGISTRSLDRYIKSGKIRSKKDGKIVYINNSDVENLVSGGKKQEIIVENKNKKKEKDNDKGKKFTKQDIIMDKKGGDYIFVYEETEIVAKKEESFDDIQNFAKNVYKDLKQEIEKKDEIIQDLSIKLGKAEEIMSNSINLLDYKKSQFLLEESKNYLNNEIGDLKVKNIDLEKKLRYEKSSNIILIFIVLILFIVAIIIWFKGI